MTTWRETTLDEFITIKHGFAFKGEHFTSEGEGLVLTPGNFPIGGGLVLRPGKDRYYSGGYPDEFQLDPGDLMVVMTDLTQNAPILGSPAWIPASPLMLHNQRLGKVEIRKGACIDRRFLYYVLLSDTSRAQVRATATGATVRHTAPSRIQAVKVCVPGLPEQAIIGAALGDIDDLIENNRRRVALLEEMARELYREWFVRFRFPGHESVPLVDSPLGPIPEGWSVEKLGDVAQLRYGKGLTKNARRPGQFAVVGSAGIVGWHDTSLIVGPAVVLGRKGNVGSVTWVDGPCWPIDTTYYVESQLPLQYLVEQLRAMEFVNTHAAVPGLDRAQVYSKLLVVPPLPLMEKHAEVFETLHSESRVLNTVSDNLTAMRDLLLPKLVTGQIDVSDLDLEPVAGAS